MDVAKLFSAVALFAFQRLLVLYVDSFASEALQDGHATSAARYQKKLMDSFQRLITAGLQQYICLGFVCNSLLVLVKTLDWQNPQRCEQFLSKVASVWFPRHEISLTISDLALVESQHTRSSSLACEDVWNSVSLLMVLADSFTCGIAVFSIFQYENTFSEPLHPVRPFWKFFGVKGLLSLSFLQGVLLMAAGVLSGGRATVYFRLFCRVYLVCIESFLLAALNFFAYPAELPQCLPEKVDFVDEQGVPDYSCQANSGDAVQGKLAGNDAAVVGRRLSP